MGLSHVFVDLTAETTETSKNKQWDYFKLKSFCTVKETVFRTKRQLSEWRRHSYMVSLMRG